DGTKIVLMETASRRILKSHDLEQEKVVFWKCISQETLALVTESSVYHWGITDDSAANRQFKRHESLFGCKIVNYEVENGYAVLIGECEEVALLSPFCLFRDFSSKMSTPTDGEAACFANFKMIENREPSTLFLSSKKNDQGGKLFVFEVGLVPIGNTPFSKSSIDVPFERSFDDDYPIFLQ
ncbi:hypothetical protein PMAYCL1PPCAC_20521, partial [Pristionchus mayeri]